MFSRTATIKLADDVEREGVITADAEGSRVVLGFFRGPRIGPYARVTMGRDDAADLADEITAAVADARLSADGDDDR